MLASLALIVVFWAGIWAIAWFFPNGSGPWWWAWNRLAGALCRKGALRFLVVALLPLFLRAALLPIWPTPEPYIQDEFSYLLQADTFAHGRLTNATPALAEFFESAQILVRPSYASKYPPGHAVTMALGQRIFGQPWSGIWLSCGMLAVALLWALEGWFSPQWALFGTMLAMPLCSLSYWMNSYLGGAEAAIGGALVVGAYPRVVRGGRAAGWALAAGFLILMFTRPYEGALLAMPTLVFCLFARVSAETWAKVVLVGAAGVSGIAFYNLRVTGQAMDLPYIEYNHQYLSSPQFNFVSPTEPKKFRYESMRVVDEVWERKQWENSRSPRFLVDRPLQWIAAAAMFAGGTGSFLPLIAIHASVIDQHAVFNLYNVVHIFLSGAMVLVPVLMFAPALARGRRTQFAMVLIAVSFCGSLLASAFFQHYAAPAVAPILVVVTGAYRYLRRARPMLAALIPVAAIGMSLLDGAPALLHEPEVLRVATRARLEATVKEHPGKHLVIVRNTGGIRPIEEWVYNGADLDGSAVVWAHDLGAQENRRLISYFHDREVWLFEPNVDAEWIGPYKP